MLTEQYCSFEVAKLLKEKGFNEPCHRLIREDGDYIERPSQAWNGMTKKQRAEWYIQPTHQMAMAWLREKGVYMYIEPYITISSEGYKLEGYKPWVTTFKRNWFNPLHEQWQVVNTQSYEDAVEAALKYSLEKLI